MLKDLLYHYLVLQSVYRMLSRASSAYLAQDEETSSKIQSAWIGLGSIWPLLHSNFTIKSRHKNKRWNRKWNNRSSKVSLYLLRGRCWNNESGNLQIKML